MSVVVLVELQFKPENPDQSISTFQEILPDTRAFEGCEELDISRNQDDSCNVVIVEKWVSRQHYEKYLAWREEIGTSEVIGPLLAQPPTFRFYDELVT